jgi:hypothetical protein
MSKWGTKLIKQLIAKKNTQELTKKRKKDGAWQKDPVEYAKCMAIAKKQMSEPIVVSQLNPIFRQKTKESQEKI